MGGRPRRRLTRAQVRSNSKVVVYMATDNFQRRRRRQQLQAAEGPRSSEDPVKNEDP